jgi:hypothetical protein
MDYFISKELEAGEKRERWLGMQAYLLPWGGENIPTGSKKSVTYVFDYANL